jgi:DNA-binding NarL/FixJ family response regulator
MSSVIETGQPTTTRGTITLRAVVVEQVGMLRTGLVQTLRRLEVPVIAEVATAEEAIAQLHLTRAELLLVGAHVDVDASRLVARAKALPRRAAVVHLAGTTERQEYVDLLKSGVDAILPISVTEDDLGDALLRVQQGERMLGRTSLAAVRADLSHERPTHVLSRRELEVLSLLPTRRTLAEIGQELFVSTATVKSHTSRLYAKLGARDRHTAVERAVALGILA